MPVFASQLSRSRFCPTLDEGFCGSRMVCVKIEVSDHGPDTVVNVLAVGNSARTLSVMIPTPVNVCHEEAVDGKSLNCVWSPSGSCTSSVYETAPSTGDQEITGGASAVPKSVVVMTGAGRLIWKLRKSDHVRPLSCSSSGATRQ